MPAHVARFPVRFHEIDGAGIVYTPRFFDYFHMAFEDFFGAEVGVPYHVWIREKRIGFPTVHIAADFRAPLRYGMEVEVELFFVKLGRSSFVVDYAANEAAGRTLCCKAEITSVVTDLDRLDAREIPEVLRKAFARFTK